jgi:hypothetical protein
MQTANVLLALGGKRGETVPKYSVTPAEIAVLQYLHGADAVYDIDIQTDTVERTNRQEIERLRQFYSRRDGENVVSPAVNTLFPGVGASVPKTFAEMELPEELFIVTERRVTAGEVIPVKDGFDAMTANELRSYAETNGIDTTGLTRKVDLLEAVKLGAKGKPDAGIFSED